MFVSAFTPKGECFMDFVTTQTYLGDILHNISQALLAPDIVLLILFIAYAVFCIGSIIVEVFTERKHFKEASPAFLSALMNCETGEIPQTVRECGLLNRQKVALLTVYDYRSLPGDALMALARKLVAREETRYNRIIGRNEMGMKAAPMLGLMGTLIPLGPGIAALGTGNLVELSTSIIVAFDTTVAGLATAVVCMIIVKIRRNWYDEYMNEFDSAMATMLQRIREMKAAGEITSSKPTDYAEVYADALKRSHQNKEAKQAAAEIAAEASIEKEADSVAEAEAAETGAEGLPNAEAAEKATDDAPETEGAVEAPADDTTEPAPVVEETAEASEEPKE